MQQKRVADILARQGTASCSGMDHGYGICQGKQRSQMLRDVSGHYWCPEHRHRGELLNWASKHGYPAIQFLGEVKPCYPVQGLPDCARPVKYAIGVDGFEENKMLWESALLMGSQDMVDAAIRCIKRDQECAS